MPFYNTMFSLVCLCAEIHIARYGWFSPGFLNISVSQVYQWETSVVAERSTALDPSSGIIRMWVWIPARLVMVLVSLGKTLNHNCFVLRMGRKAVGPVCCAMHIKEPRTLIVKEKGACPGVSRVSCPGVSRVCVGFLRVLRFPPTSKDMHSILLSLPRDQGTGIRTGVGPRALHCGCPLFLTSLGWVKCRGQISPPGLIKVWFMILFMILYGFSCHSLAFGGLFVVQCVTSSIICQG